MNEKMKFVVWGAGFRGRKLLSILKEENEDIFSIIF